MLKNSHEVKDKLIVNVVLTTFSLAASSIIWHLDFASLSNLARSLTLFPPIFPSIAKVSLIVLYTNRLFVL